MKCCGSVAFIGIGLQSGYQGRRDRYFPWASFTIDPDPVATVGAVHVHRAHSQGFADPKRPVEDGLYQQGITVCFGSAAPLPGRYDQGLDLADAPVGDRATSACRNCMFSSFG